MKNLAERKYNLALPKIKIFLESPNLNREDGRQEFCLNILKNFSVESPLIGEESKDVTSFLEVVRLCTTFIERTRMLSTKDLPMEKRLYGALLFVLQNDSAAAVKLCRILRQSLSKELQRQIEEVDNIAKIMLFNSYLVLWNSSINLEADASVSQDRCKYLMVLEMRLEALKCFCSGKDDLQKFSKQALQAVQFCKSHFADTCTDGIDSYYEAISKLTITKLVHVPKDDVLICWLHMCLSRTSFLIKHGCPRKTLEVVTAILNTEFPNHLSAALVNNKRTFVTFCLKILRVAANINFQLNAKLPTADGNDVSKILQKCLKALPEFGNVMSTADGTKMAVFLEALDLLQQQGTLLALSDKNRINVDRRNVILAIVKILLFRVRLINESRDNETCFVNQDLCNLHNILHMYNRMVAESDSDDASIAVLTSDISEVIEAAKQLQQGLGEFQSEGSHLLTKLENGRIIGCIGNNFHQKMLYAHAIPFLKMKLTLDLTYKNTTDCNSNLLKVLEMVVGAMKKEGLLHDALCCIAQVYCYSKECRSSCMVMWTGVKLTASKCKQRHIQKITMKKLIESDENLKRLVASKRVYRILESELEAYKSAQYDSGIDCAHVIEDMISCCPSVEIKAKLLIEMIQLQWSKKDSLSGCQSAAEYCKTAVDILKKSLPAQGVSILHCYLATVYLWKSILFLERSQSLAEKRVLQAQKIIPLEEQLNANINVDEANQRADVTSSYMETTINLECKYTAYLERSLKLWTEIITAKTSVEYPTNSIIGALKTVAELCALSRRDTKEMLAWSLAYKVAKTSKDLAESATCLSKVIVTLTRLGFMNEAQAFMEESRSLFIKLNPNVTEECHGLLNLHLAESELHLMTGAVWNGWKILRNVMENTVNKTDDCISMLLLKANANILATKYSLLPTSVHIERSEDMSPMDYAYHAYRNALVIKEDRPRDKSFKEPLRFIEIRYKILNCLLNATVNLAHVDQHVGAINEARFILKDKLIHVQKLSLASWSVEFLLLLAKLDLLSGFFADCDVKLNGVECIVNSEGSLDGFIEDWQDDPEDMVEEKYEISQPKIVTRRFPTKTNQSVGLTPRMSTLPEWLHLNTDCNCSVCCSSTLRRLMLDLMTLRAEYLLEQGHNNLALVVMYKIQNATVMTDAAKAVVSQGVADVHKMKDYAVGKEKPRKVCDDQSQQFSIWSCQFLLKFAKTCYENNDRDMAMKNLKKMMGIMNESHRFRGHHEKYVLMATANYYMVLLKLSDVVVANKMSTSDLFDQVWQSSVEVLDFDMEDDELLELVNGIEQLKMKEECKTPHNVVLATKKGTSCRAPVKSLFNPSIICISDDSDEENTSHHISKQIPPKIKSSKKVVVDSSPEDAPNEIVFKYETPAQTSRLARKTNKKYQEIGELSTKLSKSKIGRSTARVKTLVIDDVKGIVPKSPLREPNTIERNNSDDSGAFTVAPRRLRSILKSTDTETDGSSIIATKKNKVKPKLAFRMQSSSDDSEVFEKDDVPCPMPVNRVTRQSTRSLSASSNSSCITILSSSRSISMKESLRNSDSEDEEQEVVRGSSPEVEKSLRLMKSRAITIPKTGATSTANKGLIREVLSEVTCLLEEAISLIIHYPACPIYTQLCKLLPFCSGEGNPLTSFCAAESVMCSLRHDTLFNITRKTKAVTNKLNATVDCGNSINAKVCRNDLEGYNKRRDAMKFYANVEESLVKMKELIDNIPEDWTVVQINAEPIIHRILEKESRNPDLLITRYRRGKEPLVMKIKGSVCTGFQTYKSELKFIFAESAKSFQQSDKKTWWSMRKGLDSRLKTFLESVENSWIGPWKGLFLGKSMDVMHQEVVEKLVNSIFDNYQSHDISRISRERLEVLISASPWMEVSALKKGLAQILNCTPNNYTIQATCTSILKYKTTLKAAVERHPVVLILDKATQSVPWESLPILRGNSAVRMPSLHFLIGHLKLWEHSLLSNGVDTTNAFYVLNPSQDLPGTQVTFEGNFNRRKWAGTSGKEPSEEICAKALTSNELFVYCGHGSGSKYFGNAGVSSLRAKATALLIGCSSVRLDTQSAYLDPSGHVLRYMIAGCPCVVGNMWDVTDRDIDRFLMGMLNAWTPVEKSQQEKRIDRAVTLARSVCELKYMIGSAPVVYGLPVQALSIL